MLWRNKLVRLSLSRTFALFYYARETNIQVEHLKVLDWFRLWH